MDNRQVTLLDCHCLTLQSSVMGSRAPAPLDWQQLLTLLDSTLDGALMKVGCVVLPPSLLGHWWGLHPHAHVPPAEQLLHLLPCILYAAAHASPCLHHTCNI
jgi:hypothetical protein